MLSNLVTFKTLGVISLAHYGSTAAIHSTSLTPRDANVSSTYKLVADYTGAAFFNGFSTFTGADPTTGHVKYINKQAAMPSELIGLIYNATSNTSLAYIGVDHTNKAPNGRQAMRLNSVDTFNIGMLLVADVQHMPSGCGLWPALWTLGTTQSWPDGGEIDIMETVHNDDYNHITLHSSSGCSVDGTTSLFQGNLTDTNCNANNGSDGCSVGAVPESNFTMSHGTCMHATAGAAFNTQGGALYVMSWTTSGVTVWMIPRDYQPADLMAGKPDPSTWTFKPLVKFTGSGCDFNAHFQSMQIIINTDFCGSWAGDPKVWQSSGCATQTNTATCNDYVADNPDAFKDANWLFNGIKVYSTNANPTGTAPAT
ncbi:putative endo-1,3(4)-beta-glucanase [Acrodontium crateriforme]|uniref:Endo-1,3(4)-beta-glucanase n=1 Tax=Acrodontium crateriforme TaxID=150365 RepID=A0AAQ3R902_9PEZI|nr:putative endo-1,3(4)-beta-glucanase [Acrodontium crateriforme]